MYPKYGDTATGQDEDEEASDEPADDDLRWAITDAHREAKSANENRKLNGMLEDHTTRKRLISGAPVLPISGAPRCATTITPLLTVGWKSGWQDGSGCVEFCIGEWQDGVGDVQARGAAFQ
jgi:hypothetical protein